MSDYLLHRRGLKNGTVKTEPKKEQKPLPKRSEKMKEAFKGYKKQVKAFLSRPENLKCKIQMACTGVVAECVHHVAGRTGEKLKDEKDWLPSCAKCNLEVEIQDGKARELGFKKTRITKVSK